MLPQQPSMKPGKLLNLPGDQSQRSHTPHLCACGSTQNFEICCAVTVGPKSGPETDCCPTIKNAAILTNKDIKNLFLMTEITPDPPDNLFGKPSVYCAYVCLEVSGPSGNRTLIRGPKAGTFEGAMQGLEHDVGKKLDLWGNRAAGDWKWLLDSLEG